MPEKTRITKRLSAPAKTAIAARKPATAQPVAARAVVAVKPEKKSRKDKKAHGKAEIKIKVVRDSFTMPQGDYAKIAELKQVCLKAGVQVKKSELLRAGLHALSKLSLAQLRQTIARMEQIKTGRPKKS